MMIDFHTHAFPDQLAPKALPVLAAKVGYAPFGIGTVSDLIDKMDQDGIGISVVCNIATNPRQQSNVNNFAIETMKKHGNRLICLGSVHPDSENITEELTRLKNAGLPGIKIHPDYMETTIDSPKFDPIFDLCTDLGLFIITHAGFDVYSPHKVHANPDMILRRLQRNPEIRLICAHFGGNMMWDEVEEKLCGKNLWIDTSMGVLEGLTEEQARRIIERHGTDKVLFGTDFPWCSAKTTVSYINSLGLSEEAKEKIFRRNAEKLLGL